MKRTLLTTAAALFALATTASAAVISPTSDDGGDMMGGDARGTADLAYDGDATTFFEFEFGETANFFFGSQSFQSPGAVIEITTGGEAGRIDWDEYIAIQVGVEGDESSFVAVTPSVLSNSVEGPIAFTFDGIFNTIRITDVTEENAIGSVPLSARPAGFDLAEISVTAAPAVPLPAGILLLGTALGGLGIARRRKKAA